MDEAGFLSRLRFADPLHAPRAGFARAKSLALLRNTLVNA
jgi:hypothetical protein